MTLEGRSSPKGGREEVYVITSPPPIYHRYLPIQFLDLLE
jgi:hypothetical protein